MVFLSMIFFQPGMLLAGQNMNEIPLELKQFDIKDEFIQLPSKEVGSIGRIRGTGKVVSVHKETREAYYAREENAVYENDALYTMNDARCRIAFKGGDVVIMSSDTHLEIEQVYNSILKRGKKSLFAMPKGKAIFYALRLLRHKQMTFQLKTPTANIGVRGTKFGIEIEGVGPDQTQSAESEEPLTRVYVFEGEIQVTSLIDGTMKAVRQNEVLEADRRGLNDVKFDPEKARAFLEDVMSRMDEGAGKEHQVEEDRLQRQQMERMDKMMDARQGEIEKEITHDREPMRSRQEH